MTAALPLCRGEESPGSTGQWWSLMATGGNPRESATENRPPSYMGGKGETVR